MFKRIIKDDQERPLNALQLNRRPLSALFISIIFFCALALSYSLWIQKTSDLIPCKFCRLQQISYTLIGLTSFLGLLGNQKRVLVALKIILILAAGIAGYHALVQFGVIKDLCIRHSPLSTEQFDQILLQSLSAPPPLSACSSKLPLLLGIPLSIYNFIIFIALYCFVQFLTAKLSQIKRYGIEAKHCHP